MKVFGGHVFAVEVDSNPHPAGNEAADERGEGDGGGPVQAAHGPAAPVEGVFDQRQDEGAWPGCGNRIMHGEAPKTR